MRIAAARNNTSRSQMAVKKIDLSAMPDWPRYLSRPQAAAYLGVSDRLFMEEVDEGIWPPGQKRPFNRQDDAKRLVWDRLLLDFYANQASGLDRRR
jgi:hypothetical protein